MVETAEEKAGAEFVYSADMGQTHYTVHEVATTIHRALLGFFSGMTIVEGERGELIVHTGMFRIEKPAEVKPPTRVVRATCLCPEAYYGECRCNVS